MVLLSLWREIHSIYKKDTSFTTVFKRDSSRDSPSLYPSCKDLRSRTYHSLIHSCAEVSLLYVLTIPHGDWLWIQFTGFYPLDHPPFPPQYMKLIVHIDIDLQKQVPISIYTHTFLYRYIFQFMLSRRSAVL